MSCEYCYEEVEPDDESTHGSHKGCTSDAHDRMQHDRCLGCNNDLEKPGTLRHDDCNVNFGYGK